MWELACPHLPSVKVVFSRSHLLCWPIGNRDWPFNVDIGREGKDSPRKTTILGIRLTCVYQGIRNVSFSEDFTYVLSEWSLNLFVCDCNLAAIYVRWKQVGLFLWHKVGFYIHIQIYWSCLNFDSFCCRIAIVLVCVDTWLFLN